jgi:hypothetical protein
MDKIVSDLYNLIKELKTAPEASATKAELANVAESVREIATWIRDRETYEQEQKERS